MTPIEITQVYGHLFTAEVTNEVTKQLWLNNALGALTTVALSRLQGCDEFIQQIYQYAKKYDVHDKLLVESEKVQYLLQVQGMLNQAGSVDPQQIFDKLK